MSIRRRIIATLLFLFAALVVVHVGARLYMQRANSTSMHTIQGNLNSSAITSRFKVEEARKAGYSEEEIAKHLFEENAKSTEELMQTLLLVEVALFAVAAAVGMGIAIMNPRTKRAGS